MKTIGLIGGTGGLAVAQAESDSPRSVTTPYGETSSPILSWTTDRGRFYFIARHGLDGSIPPHLVNYRANVWALHERSPDYVIGINAVGGISPAAEPVRLVFPDQLVDYTWGRAHTFADGEMQPLQHIEFAAPFGARARAALLAAASQLGLDFHPTGTYGATQGPRLETMAEIDRMERDGCDIVGMTGMPEAALAREVGLDYAICGVVVNRAAGRATGGGTDAPGIHAEMERYLDAGMEQVRRLLNHA